MSEIKPILFFGGTSNERHVSVASAKNVSKTLTSAALLFWAPDGGVYEVSRDELDRHERPFEVDFKPSSPAKYTSVAAALDDMRSKGHVFVLCFHGGEGEDGTLQAQFEKHGIPFTGSGSEASALAMDKRRAKDIARKAGLSVAKDMTIAKADVGKALEQLSRMFKENGPIIVKPAGGGSTLGVHFIRNEGELSNAAAEMAKLPEDYLVETLIKGRELTIGVVDMFGTVKALPPSEVLLEANRDFDYQGKYLGKGVKEITPADILDSVREEVQFLAVKIHSALGCEGYSRTDFIVTTDAAYYLETNTLPGLSGASFIPQQLAAARITLQDFLASQIQLAVSRVKRS